VNNEFKNADEAFTHYLNGLVGEGAEPFRDTQALFNECFTVLNPLDNKITCPAREWSQTYADREWEWYLSGDRDASGIAKYAPMWHNMMDVAGQVWSNYGWWWQHRNQYEVMIHKLTQDTATRQAIMVHFSPTFYSSMMKDVPCNLVLNFYIVEGFLNLTIFARSIDLWFGFCNDQYQFSKLMEKVGKEISKPVGTMTYMITNFHLYNKQVDYVRNYVKTGH